MLIFGLSAGLSGLIRMVCRSHGLSAGDDFMHDDDDNDYGRDDDADGGSRGYPNVGATLSTDKPWIDDSDRDVLYPALSANVLQTLCFRRSVLILAYPGLVRLFFFGGFFF